MKILILGTGCPKCKKLFQATEKAVAELGLECEVEKVTDIGQIVSYGILSTPGFVVDGVVKFSGKLPSITELKNILSN